MKFEVTHTRVTLLTEVVTYHLEAEDRDGADTMSDSMSIDDGEHEGATVVNRSDSREEGSYDISDVSPIDEGDDQ